MSQEIKNDLRRTNGEMKVRELKRTLDFRDHARKDLPTGRKLTHVVKSSQDDLTRWVPERRVGDGEMGVRENGLHDFLKHKELHLKARGE